MDQPLISNNEGQADLCRFLQRVASGEGRTLVIVTSRVALPIEAAPFLLHISVGSLSEPAAVELLRAQGSQGASDHALKELTRLCGGHPQTIVVARNLLVSTYHNDGEQLVRVLEQAGFNDLLPAERVRYLCRDHLRSLATSMLRMIFSLGLWNHPAPLDALAASYIDADEGADAPARNRRELDVLITELVQRGLVRVCPGGQRPLYALEPVVENLLGFRRNAPRPYPVLGEYKDLKPFPSRSVDGDRVATWIGDATAAHLPGAAVSLYRGMSMALVRDSDHRLGEQATAPFFLQNDPRRPIFGLTPSLEGILLGDRGVFLCGLGRISESVRIQELARERDWQDPIELGWDEIRLAESLTYLGQLRSAQTILKSARKIARVHLRSHPNFALVAYSRAAAVELLLGRVRVARRMIDRAAAAQGTYTAENAIGIPAVSYVDLLLRTGRIEHARTALAQNRLYCRSYKREGDLTQIALQLARIEVATNRPLRALALSRQVRRRAEKMGAKIIQCEALVLQGEAHVLLDQPSTAHDAFRTALEAADACGLAIVKSDILLAMAKLTAASDAQAAVALAMDARNLARVTKYRWGLDAAKALLQQLS